MKISRADVMLFHCWRWLGGPLVVLLSAVIWNEFVRGVELVRCGRTGLGWLLIIAYSLLGGINLGSIGKWWDLCHDPRIFLKPIKRRPVVTNIPDAMFQKVYEHFAQAAVRYFNAKGEQAPFFFAVQINAAANEFTCLGAVPSKFSAMFYRNDRAKEHIKYLIAAFLSDTSTLRQQLAADNEAPDLIVQVVEVWLAHRTYAKGEKIDLTQPPPLPSESQDRREAVAVMVHSLQRTVVGYCPIGGSPRRASYAPCDLAGGLTGRMSMNPLPSEDATITKH